MWLALAVVGLVIAASMSVSGGCSPATDVPAAAESTPGSSSDSSSRTETDSGTLSEPVDGHTWAQGISEDRKRTYPEVTDYSAGERWYYETPADGDVLAIGYGVVMVEMQLASGAVESVLLQGIVLSGPSAEQAQIDTVRRSGRSTDLYVRWPRQGEASGLPGQGEVGNQEITLAIDAALLSEPASAGDDGRYSFTLRRGDSPRATVRCLDDPGISLEYPEPREAYRVAAGEPCRFEFTFDVGMDRDSTEQAVLWNAGRWDPWGSQRAYYRFDWVDERTVQVTLEPVAASGATLGICAAGAMDLTGRRFWDTEVLRVEWSGVYEILEVASDTGVFRTLGTCPPGVRPVSISPGRAWVLGLEEDWGGEGPSYPTNTPPGYFAWVGNLRTGEWCDLTCEGVVSDACWVDDDQVLLADGHRGWYQGWTVVNLGDGETTRVTDTLSLDAPAVVGGRVALLRHAGSMPDQAEASGETRESLDVVVYSLNGEEEARYEKAVCRCLRGLGAEPYWEHVSLLSSPNGEALVYLQRDEGDKLVLTRLSLSDGVTRTYPDASADASYIAGAVFRAASSQPFGDTGDAGAAPGPLCCIIWGMGARVVNLDTGEIELCIDGWPPHTEPPYLPDPSGERLAVPCRSTGALQSFQVLDVGTGEQLLADLPGTPFGWSLDGRVLYAAVLTGSEGDEEASD